MSGQCEAKIYHHKEWAFWHQVPTVVRCTYATGETKFCRRHQFLFSAGLVDYTQADGRRWTYPEHEIPLIVAEERYLGEAL